MQPSPFLVRECAPAGTLRAALNLGNPVLARSRTAPESPAGVTVDLARGFAAVLGVGVDFVPFDTPGAAGDAIARGDADIGFLAIDPKRAETLHFTAPYVQIEGCYLVRDSSPLRENAEVDRAGTRVCVGAGSAYGLFLARHLGHATLVEVDKSEQVVDALAADPALHVAAGVRQQMQADAARLAGMRLLPGAFMVIRQAMVMPRGCSPEARQLLEEFTAEQRRAGFIAQALERHGIEGATVLP